MLVVGSLCVCSLKAMTEGDQLVLSSAQAHTSKGHSRAKSPCLIGDIH